MISIHTQEILDSIYEEVNPDPDEHFRIISWSITAYDNGDTEILATFETNNDEGNVSIYTESTTQRKQTEIHEAGNCS